MSELQPAWADAVRALADRAPPWMHERASAELHIGGFTQTRLETPVLQMSDLDDPDAARRTTVFFLAVALASGAAVARVQCARETAPNLIGTTRDALGDTVDHIDDENVSLMRYFDVFFKPAADVSSADGMSVADALRRVLDD